MVSVPTCCRALDWIARRLSPRGFQGRETSSPAEKSVLSIPLFARIVALQRCFAEK